jgi:hypothetical protein
MHLKISGKENTWKKRNHEDESRNRCCKRKTISMNEIKSFFLKKLNIFDKLLTRQRKKEREDSNYQYQGKTGRDMLLKYY